MLYVNTLFAPTACLIDRPRLLVGKFYWVRYFLLRSHGLIIRMVACLARGLEAY